jgi:hypothetical protein
MRFFRLVALAALSLVVASCRSPGKATTGTRVDAAVDESVEGQTGGAFGGGGAGIDASSPADANDFGTGDASETNGAAGATQAPQSVSDKYNYAPSSRTLTPVSVYAMNGSIVNPNNVLTGNATAIVGKGAYVVLDFGKEVGGVVTLTFAAAADANQSVGIAFSESSLYVGPAATNRTALGRRTAPSSSPCRARRRTRCHASIYAAASAI